MTLSASHRGMKHDRVSRRWITWLTLTVFLVFAWLFTAPHAAAQSLFPFPGQGQTSEPAPEAPPEEPSPQAEAVPDAVQDLIRILRDPEARDALIAELERGSDSVSPSVAPETPETPAEIDIAPNTDNIGIQFLRYLREVVVTDFRSFFVRIERIPYNMSLALRAFGGDLIPRTAKEIALIVGISYGILYTMRLITFPLARRVARSLRDHGWFRKLWRRVVVSILQILPIFVASFATVFYYAASNSEIETTSAQVNYLSAFVMVELVRTAVRFFTSPATPELRLFPLPDRGARLLQRYATISIVFLGYGQFVLVPAVTAETSIFVGRAFSSLLGMISVLYLIAIIYSNRRSVATWLRRNEGDGALDNALGAMAERWHMPVLIYLGILFVIVSTHTGNVLLPLLNSTLKFIVIIAIGYAASSLARGASRRRMKMPGIINRQLPMLERRVNTLVPAFFAVVRLMIVVAVFFTLLSTFNIFAPLNLLGTNAGSAILSGILGVLIIATVTAMLYLALASWVDFQLNPFVGTAPTPRMITLLTLLRNAVTIVLVVIALMLSLSQLGLDIGPLLASAGVIGLAISFGAQKMVEDIITGVFIQLENAMNVGDVVDVGGVVGTVEKLTVRSVTLRDLKGVVHMIPFSSASMISNYMREFSYYVCDMGVAYRESIDDVKAAMFDAFEELRKNEDHARFILGDMEWFGLNTFDASAIVLRARIKTAPGQQWGIGRAYNAILKRVFDERSIEIPFPHQTLYFGEDRKGNAPPVQVVLHTATPDESKGTPVTASPKAPAPDEGDAGPPEPAAPDKL